ncbi:MAG TPA: hypothetical protein PK970_05425 [Hyphomicrobiaceae bacterium]|nr:hypothetical protein [Hyphomicrobiaceae bacterium]
MAFNILVLGASYGSLLATKCIMAGHDATLVCRSATAALINREGTVVRLALKDEKTLREISSKAQPGRLRASVPQDVDVAAFDLVVLAMQEPQYADHGLRALLARIAATGLPCLSLMNMPPLPYLLRLPSIDAAALAGAYTNAQVWERFFPGAVSLCSPDPQAFRPQGEPANVLQVGLPTNFKAAPFASDAHTAILKLLEADIDAITIDGKDVPVKLRVHDSLFVPLAKWSMLLTGNYRCVLPGAIRPIREAVHGDIDRSREIYDFVNGLVVRLGADPADLVPFEKYAKAAEGLLKPSSVARAIDAGAPYVERVDRLVRDVGRSLGIGHPDVDETVATVDDALRANRVQAA